MVLHFMFDPYPSLNISFDSLPNEIILHTLNNQKPEKLSSEKFSACKYMIEGVPYVFKFLSEDHANNHYYNSEIYRFLSLPVHTNRLFSFKQEQLSGFLKLNAKKSNKLTEFFMGKPRELETGGVYMPYMPGRSVAGNGSKFSANVLGNEHLAALCVAHAYDTRYFNVIERRDDSALNHKRYIIDPEFGIMATRESVENNNSPSHKIIIPEIGTVIFKQAEEDIKHTSMVYKDFANPKGQSDFIDIVTQSSIEIVKKLHTTPCPVLEEFQGMKERMIGCAIWVNTITNKLRA